MKRRLIVVVTLLAGVAAQAQSTRAPQIESITAAQMRAHLFFPASDTSRAFTT